jgi:uncharacterized membrane protein YkoI
MVRTSDKIILGIMVILLIGMSSVFITALNSENFFGKEDAKSAALRVVSGEVKDIELNNENGQLIYEVDIQSGNTEKEVKINQQGQVIGIENEEEDIPITGNALEKASLAALDYIGEGEVTDSEIGDEEGYYEIEITLNNGNEVDVHLDKNFNVLSTEYE